MAKLGKYSKEVPKKKHPVRNTVLIVLLILLILIGAVFLYFWSRLDLIQFDDEIDKTVYSTEPLVAATEAPIEIIEEETVPQVDDIVDISDLELIEGLPLIPDSDILKNVHVTNILIIGTDERTQKFSSDARSDSMILVSIDRDANTGKLVSLERGMGVPILEGRYEGNYDWLTHMFSYGGADLLMKTIEHCFKVEVDRYIRFNFNSVVSVVDAIGGIEVELSSEEAAYLGRYYDDNTSTGSQQPIVSGRNRLDGGNALAFARLRWIDSDWQRVQRQRKVILAVVDELKGSSFTELNELLDVVLPMVQTNLTKLEIADLMFYAANLLSATFDQMTIPQHGTYGGMKGLGGRSLYAVDFEENSRILREFLYGES